MQKALDDGLNQTLEELYQKANINEIDYKEALKGCANTPTIFLKRSPNETCINNYNINILKIWRANHDIQFVTDAYACAMYILSYVSKGERQMGELLKAAAKECQNDGSIKQQLRKLGNVFLTHSELSAQEAAYRAISLPLKRCSRVVVFVNSGLPEDRIRILKPQWKLQALPEDSEEIFEIGMVDHYASRPDSLEDICLADFATSYRLKGAPCMGEDNSDIYHEDADNIENENENIRKCKTISLKNSLGIMVKRSFRAILRTPRFSRVKYQKQFYHSRLMLYLPWRNENTDLIGGYATYHDFYDAVEDQVLSNMKNFEQISEELDFALEHFETLPENAWDQLATEQQKVKYDEKEEKLRSDDQEANIYLQDYPGLPEMGGQIVGNFSVEIQPKKVTKRQYLEATKCLNDQQKIFFDWVHSWCRQQVQSKKSGKLVKPFHKFLTGGAGTGKSHLVRTIVDMAQRELCALSESPDQLTVLVMAPTGIAALNIDGMTIHHALSIPAQVKNNEYPPLAYEKLAAARHLFQNLYLIVIDEISMVSLKTLYFIHRRLQDIRGINSHSSTIFGGYSILAVGDFYQLEPVSIKVSFRRSVRWISCFESFSLVAR